MFSMRKFISTLNQVRNYSKNRMIDTWYNQKIRLLNDNFDGDVSTYFMYNNKGTRVVEHKTNIGHEYRCLILNKSELSNKNDWKRLEAFSWFDSNWHNLNYWNHFSYLKHETELYVSKPNLPKLLKIKFNPNTKINLVDVDIKYSDLIQNLESNYKIHSVCVNSYSKDRLIDSIQDDYNQVIKYPNRLDLMIDSTHLYDNSKLYLFTLKNFDNFKIYKLIEKINANNNYLRSLTFNTYDFYSSRYKWMIHIKEAKLTECIKLINEIEPIDMKSKYNVQFSFDKLEISSLSTTFLQDMIKLSTSPLFGCKQNK